VPDRPAIAAMRAFGGRRSPGGRVPRITRRRTPVSLSLSHRAALPKSGIHRSRRLRCAPPQRAPRRALALRPPLARSRPLSAPSPLLKWLIPAFPSIRRRPEPAESATRCCAMADGHPRLNLPESRRSWQPSAMCKLRLIARRQRRTRAPTDASRPTTLCDHEHLHG
jgi:hypothetical protein